jgi:hypothetical protein
MHAPHICWAFVPQIYIIIASEFAGFLFLIFVLSSYCSLSAKAMRQGVKLKAKVGDVLLQTRIWTVANTRM